MRGKLIVIEGGDGSGKTVQAKLLINYFKKKRISAEYYDFPQYYHSFHGETVARFLRGEFGDIDEVSPFLASFPFALDRASVRDKMKSSLAAGYNIVANRYATSNLIYQAAKFTDLKKRDDFINWVSELEYEVNSIPRENFVIYLNVPWEIGLKLTKQKKPRAYLKGHDDIHENHHGYREKVQKLYLQYCKKKSNWLRVDCSVSDRLLSPEQIHSKVIQILSLNKVD